MLTLKIVSPEKVVYQGPVENVTVPGTLGSFEILNNHAPIISSLEAGRVTYTTDQGRQQMDIEGGFVEVKKNVVNLCVEV
ncbi:ATP synthase F1 subunit epsilon [Prevotella sp. AGR2160]|uniref:ATP synthase F1 subunit epsilon n=1 Tax=Prevotella sp. AGR2160 TaxID=1280674 RepID=UPI0003FD76AC|nr:ATP synthase F1 subunit epsilon [Prevotella sp. AGR2160]